MDLQKCEASTRLHENERLKDQPEEKGRMVMQANFRQSLKELISGRTLKDEMHFTKLDLGGCVAQR